MSSLESFSGIGVYEMQSDAAREVRRIMTEAGGDRLKAEQDAAKAYQEVKKAYEELLVKGSASPVAPAYASGAVGSYVSDDGGEPGSSKVVYKKSGGN
ncbi:hypothetical protein AB0280_01520 [Pseudarthrobacter sp902506025]|uniref:23S rRNA A2030 N6-methylase RlmJ n=1 Tax=Pseudarthrobacter defluvii TaxID=410837 RepID=A0ABT9UMK6_9MICC|nr:hypothetical protein [Pseudarthrobacter defluvii]MDQ0120876.1 23S rRNA A2030 N6-methylase RlmJ [Pseudarthrobacter defluvii]